MAGPLARFAHANPDPPDIPPVRSTSPTDGPGRSRTRNAAAPVPEGTSTVKDEGTQ
jgi:hypothetical protein